MAEYKMATGDTLTDADIERVSKEFEDCSWVGRLGRVRQGPAAVFGERLDTVIDSSKALGRQGPRSCR